MFVEKNKELKVLEENIKTAELLENLVEDYKQLDIFAEEDLSWQKEKETCLNTLEKELKKIEHVLLFNNEDKNHAYINIHAGSGGQEAEWWANQLFLMYIKFLDKKQYDYEIVDLSQENSQLRKATIMVKELYAYGMFKHETGVHRLSRNSDFDSANRRQTSFASVDVIPSRKETIMKLKKEDLKIDTFRSGGPGGQHQNKTESGVRITHLPTKTSVSVRNGRSQTKNKKQAMLLLESKLASKQTESFSEEKQQKHNKKEEAGFGNRIRSYVFRPYQMVKDHRSGYQTSSIQTILSGEIEPMLNHNIKFFSKEN